MYDMKREELRNIENYPDYFVGEFGNVYSTRVSPKFNPQGNFYKLKLWDAHPSGYLNAGLYNKPGVKNKHYFRVHRLIWEAFNGAIPDGYVVDHINGDKKDNRLENLQLLTWSENLLKYHRVDKLKKTK
jgi:hypothetical protein